MPLSEGLRGLRPSRLAERVEGQEDGRGAHLFLLRLIEMLAAALAVSLAAVLVLLVLFAFYLTSRDARRAEVDDKIARVECIALRAIDPHSPLGEDLQRDLDRLSRSCADVHLRLRPTPSASTTTKTVTRKPPRGISAPQIPGAPAASSSEEPEPPLARTSTPARPSQSRSAPRPSTSSSRSTRPTPPPPTSSSPAPRPIVEISVPGLIGLRVG